MASAAPPSLCAHCSLPVPSSRRATGTAPQFCCFGCRFAFEFARPAAADPASVSSGIPASGGTASGGTLLLRLGLSVFLSMNMMAFTFALYARQIYAPSDGPAPPLDTLGSLFAYLLMLLCTVVIVMLGLPLALDAIATTARGRVDANLLICIGVGAAYILSVIHTLNGQGGLYFDTAAMTLVLVALGHYLDSAAKRRATVAVRDLLGSTPAVAFVRRQGQVVQVQAEEVRVGETVRVRAGEEFPIDGRVLEGLSHVHEASLTGESKPRSVAAGGQVYAGTVNLDGQLWVEARQVGRDRAIAQVQRLLEEARLRQAPIQRLADRIAAFFVPLVTLLAIGVFAWNAWNGRPAAGLFDALSVLLISCPCALGLAAPLATWSALGRAARCGVLIDSAATLERAAAVGAVFFDKTGTLTDARLQVESIETFGHLSRTEALRLAAAVESSSLHPIASAVIEMARSENLPLPESQSAVALPGLGVEARIDGRLLRLGSRRLAQERASLPSPLGEAGRGAPRTSSALGPPSQPPPEGEEKEDDLETIDVYLMDEAQVLARFRLSEKLRPDAAAAIEQLRRDGMTLAVLTGDQSGPARRLAAQLHVEVQAQLLPAEKLQRLTEARRSLPRGRAVAMVGDGINDAPVLAGADIGFAVGSAADLARQAGNIHLISERLDRIPLTLALARHAMRRIRLNLAWSFGYNAIGLALAAAGMLNPIFAASAMYVSSLFIILSSRAAGDVPGLREESSPAPSSLVAAPTAG